MKQDGNKNFNRLEFQVIQLPPRYTFIDHFFTISLVLNTYIYYTNVYKYKTVDIPC